MPASKAGRSMDPTMCIALVEVRPGVQNVDHRLPQGNESPNLAILPIAAYQPQLRTAHTELAGYVSNS